MRSKQFRFLAAAAVGVFATAAGVSAAVLHQWEFDDALNTSLGDAVNGASAASWLGSVTNSEMATDGLGSLAFGHTTNTVDSFLPLSGATNGLLLVRVDYSSWDLGAVDGDEQVSFYLEGSGNVRMELLRWANTTWNLTGWSPPDLNSVQTFSSVEPGPVATVLELDLDLLKYRVWWGDGTASGWSASAWQDANPALAVSTLRLRKAGDFSQVGDTVLIDRITVADQLGDVVDLPPYPQNLVAGWTDDSPSGTATAPGVGLTVDPVTGGASFDAAYNCSDRYYGSDGNVSYSTGPDDVKVSAVTFQTNQPNQYALITISNAFTGGEITLDELRFDWGGRFDGAPRFFYVYYDSGDLSGLAGNTLLWAVTNLTQSPSADGNVADYNDADIDLSALADHTLDVGEFATFRFEAENPGAADDAKSILDNIGFFGTVPPPVVSSLALTTVQVPVEVILIDIGNDISYRGASVANPDENGNYWNSVWSGAYYPDIIDINGNSTAVNFGFSSATGTDSYNGPAGPTDVNGPEDCDFDPIALGNLGATNAVYDFYVSSSFEIQGLDPSRRYNLTFFGSHKFHTEPTTVYEVHTDGGFTNLVASASLEVHQPGSPWLHNRDTVATITGLAPQTNDILYVRFLASDGSAGYLNALQVEATTPADAAVVTWASKLGSVYNVQEATDLVASNWANIVSGLVGSGSSMAATVVVASASAALRVVEEVTPPAATLFDDDFENGVNGWTFGFDGDAGTQWQLGTPTNVGPVGANSPANCWGTNIDADYDYGAECWLRSPAIDLTAAGAATLSWQQAVDVEPDLAGTYYDWGEVNILDADNVVLISELGGKIAGEEATPVWRFAQQSLAGAVGNVIKIEFRFTSDASIRNRAGWYIDDVEVTGE